MPTYANGVFNSWLYTVILISLVTFLVLINQLASWLIRRYLNSPRPSFADIYAQLNPPFQKVSYLVTTLVLFYLAIQLNSQAFTKEGIPYLGERYADYYLKLYGITASSADISTQIRLHDLALIFFAGLIILVVFAVLPYMPETSRDYISRNGLTFGLTVFLPSFLLGILLGVLPIVFGPQSLEQIIPSTYDSGLDIVQVSLRGEITAFLFLSIFCGLIAALIYIFLYKLKRPDLEEGLYDLLWSLSFVPAIIIGPLVLAGDPLLLPNNRAGNIVVGWLIIGGFLTMSSVANILLSSISNTFLVILVLICGLFCSLASISIFSVIFLSFGQLFVSDFQLPLRAPVSFILVILPYALLYERIWRWEFGHWWSTKWRTRIIAGSVVLLMLVGPMRYEWWKAIAAIIALVLLVALPFVPGLSLRRLMPNFPRYWGVIFLKVEPGKVRSVLRDISGKRDVYNPMVVTGVYDIIATVQARNYDEFYRHVLSIRSIKGVVQIDTGKDYTRLVEQRR